MKKFSKRLANDIQQLDVNELTKFTLTNTIDLYNKEVDKYNNGANNAYLLYQLSDNIIKQMDKYKLQSKEAKQNDVVCQLINKIRFEK